MQLPGQQRRAIVVPQAKRYVSAHQPRRRARSVRWVGIHVDLDRQGFFAVRGEAVFEENPGEPEPGRVNGGSGSKRAPHRVPFAAELSADRHEPAAKVVPLPVPFQGEIEVFGVARKAVEKAQRGASLEGQGVEGSRPLKSFEHPGLKVLPEHIAPVQRVRVAHQAAEVVLHTASNTSSESSSRDRT